ncbi:hypothetical protein BGZ81_000145 [Podila clonocystis]|nr:hypothetical protein BGZ81_000145 [Podila clonocystis]
MAPIAPIDPGHAIYSGSLLSLIILIIDLMAVVQVLNSNRPVMSKFLCKYQPLPQDILADTKICNEV